MMSIVMTFVGTALTKAKVELLPEKVRERAVKDLCRIHRFGVIHGDIRLPNLVWNEEQNRIMFIDFGRSGISGCKSEKSYEVHELKTLLGLNTEVEEEPDSTTDNSD